MSAPLSDRPRPNRHRLNAAWVWRMAWRDGRQHVRRLVLFMMSLVTGIAAVVSIQSLNRTLQGELDRNARELLGADVVVNASRAIDSSFYRLLDSASEAVTRDAEMASMVMFYPHRQTRLVKLWALGDEFPFFGTIQTQPPNARQQLRQPGYALVDESLATQYEISSGDSLRIGTRQFTVAGVVQKIPGSGEFSATLAPAVYISFHELDSTGLVQFGSRVRYRAYVRTGSEEATSRLVTRLDSEVKSYSYSYETVRDRKESLGQAFQGVYRFFSLLAFMALLLGCLGIASSVHLYVQEKRNDVAILRCLGARAGQAFQIFFLQVLVLGVLGSWLGAWLGVGVQQVIPFVLGPYFPVDVAMAVSWRSILEGVALGILVSLIFTLLPLLSIRQVPPLVVLRASAVTASRVSTGKILVWALLWAFPIAVAWYQTRDLVIAVAFVLAVAFLLAALGGIASGLLVLLRKFFPWQAPFVWRHALASLFRPHNQTTVLMVSIGLGAFVISVLSITQHSLLREVEIGGGRNQSNTILFDIQSSQKEGVEQLMRDEHLPVHQLVPIVTCRLQTWKGREVSTLAQGDSVGIPEWALMREYRVSYRDSLHVSESLLSGRLQSYDVATGRIGVTISEGMNETLKLALGDSLVFDVQGVPIPVVIDGVRKVNWPRDPPNFIFVFPSGVLEEAPQIWVAATRIEEEGTAARFQQKLVLLFPNVSLIDLRLVLATLEQLFSKVSMAIRFLALFSVITGLVVLTGTVINSRYVRIRENVLLRTLGARTHQLTRMLLIEYIYLGFFSGLAGVVFSWGAGWILCTYFFEIAFSPATAETLIVLIAVVAVTAGIGWMSTRTVVQAPPLQVLRKET